MGSDKKKGGKPRRKNMAAESKQRHTNNELGTGLERLSGPGGGIRVARRQKTIRELGLKRSKKMEEATSSSKQRLKDETQRPFG